MLETVLNALYLLIYKLSQQHHEVSMPDFWLKKLRPSEIKSLTQGPKLVNSRAGI